MAAAAVLVALALAQAPAPSPLRADAPPPGSASTDAGREAARAAMLDADRGLARAMASRDLEAYADLLAGDVVLATDTRPPAFGRLAARTQVAAFFAPDGPSLSWEPATSEVSDRGELGYTRGPFVYRAKGEGGRPVEHRGDYLCIWRRDPDGRWRMVVQTSLSPNPPAFEDSSAAPTRVLTANLSGDLRYELRATRLPPVTATQPTGPYERRVLRVDRRNVDGTWRPLVEAVTVGPAPQL